MQFSRDGSAAIIQKDFGAERWSIHRDRVRGAVTGNVFFTDGRSPSFLSCERLSELKLECFAAPACPAEGPCLTRYTRVGEVTVPPGFFSPADGGAGLENLLGVWRFEIATDVETIKEITFTEVGASLASFPVAYGTSGGGHDVAFVELYTEYRFGRETDSEHCWFYWFDIRSPDRVTGSVNRGQVGPDGTCPTGRSGVPVGPVFAFDAFRIGDVADADLEPGPE